MNWLAVFTAMTVADVFWAKWAEHVGKKNAARAASYGTLIVVCSAFTIMEYTSNHWLVIPAALGAYVGTFISVKNSQVSD